MNREQMNRFSNIPYIEKPRSTFKRPQKHLTSFKAGDLIPIYVDEVLPGDTHKIDVASVVRMLTPLYPVFDDLILDVMAFYVPNRLVWDHWREFQGENKLTAWEQQVKYEVPQIEAPTGGWAKGTVADYMGIPTNVGNISVNALPFKRYALIWNEFFRDENLKDAVMITTDDTTLTGSNGTGVNDTYVTTGQLGALPLKVAKTHDYFTSGLPGVQKSSDPVYIPVGSVSGSFIPVRTRGEDIPDLTKNEWPLSFVKNSDGTNPFTNQGSYSLQLKQDSNGPTGGKLNANSSTTTSTTNTAIKPSNLWADLTAGAEIGSIGTINELRTAFAIQRILEAFARGGSRYTEILQNIWGVTAPDASLQRPEYLGGERIPIQMSAVLSHTDNENSVVGETGAMSVTGFDSYICNKSFVEHGYLIITAAVRINRHTYQNGIERMWSRKTMYDFYMPQMRYLGEQAILNKEIYAQGSTVVDANSKVIDEQVFGYQERWAEYRFKPNRVSSAMRSNYRSGSLDAWHYADTYRSLPTLSSEWIDEGYSEIDRTLAVQSELEDQFLADFYIVNTTTRMMPVYSVPGLLDHY